MKLKLFALGAGALGLAGCVSPAVKQYCSTADWNAVGYSDGLNGYTRDRIGVSRDYCAKTDFGVDQGLYQSGWERGVQEYCTPSGGFRTGAENAEYRGVCSGFGEADFLAEYERGQELHPYLLNVYAARANLSQAIVALRAAQNPGGSAAGQQDSLVGALVVGFLEGFTKTRRVNNAADNVTAAGRQLARAEQDLALYLDQLEMTGQSYALPRLFDLERQFREQGFGYGPTGPAIIPEFSSNPGGQVAAAPAELASQLSAEHAKWAAILAAQSGN